MIMHDNGIQECIDSVAKSIDFNGDAKPTSPDRLRGKGIAIMWKAPAMPPNAGSSAWVEMAEDGNVTVGLGGQDIGQGTFTAMAQMAAAALGVPYEIVRIAGPVDTQYSPYEWQTVASRLTWSMGNAVVAAARDARKQILDLVAEAWKENPEDLDIVNGMVVSYKSERETSLKNMVVYGLPKDNNEGWMGGPIVGRGSFMPKYVTNLDAETGQGPRAVVHYTVGCEGLDIEIDKNTGQIFILKAGAAFDVGKAINPPW
jgi:carbon-monoxide dehydrogenase large subunit